MRKWLGLFWKYEWETEAGRINFIGFWILVIFFFPSPWSSFIQHIIWEWACPNKPFPDIRAVNDLVLVSLPIYLAVSVFLVSRIESKKR